MIIGEIKRKTHFRPLLNSFLPFSNDWITHPFPLVVEVNDLDMKEEVEDEDEDEDDDVELKDDIV